MGAEDLQHVVSSFRIAPQLVGVAAGGDAGGPEAGAGADDPADGDEPESDGEEGSPPRLSGSSYGAWGGTSTGCDGVVRPTFATPDPPLFCPTSVKFSAGPLSLGMMYCPAAAAEPFASTRKAVTSAPEAPWPRPRYTSTTSLAAKPLA